VVVFDHNRVLDDDPLGRLAIEPSLLEQGGLTSSRVIYPGCAYLCRSAKRMDASAAWGEGSGRFWRAAPKCLDLHVIIVVALLHYF
jgi:hypothetical protein